MIEVFDCDQGTEVWRECRAGIPTASKFAALMARGEGKTRRAYMLDLIGERITGEPSEGFSNGHTERGHIMEPDARGAYAFLHDVEPRQVGFVRNSGICKLGAVGCSPDSLIHEDGSLEIKTKLPRLQAEVLLADKVPAEHMAQIQGVLWVCEREWCDFVSYWPKMPMFTKRVYRDSALIVKLQTEVAQFYEDMLELEHTIRGMQ